MFKKSLLALTIASASITAANAANIVTSVTENTAGAFVVTNPTSLGCSAYVGGAADTGVNIGTDKFAAGNVTGIYERTTVTGTPATDGADTCTVKETLVTTPVSSSIEKAALGTVTLQAKIVAGIGGYEDESTLTVDITGANVDLTATTAPTLEGVAGTVPVLDITANRIRFTVPSGQDVSPGEILTITNVFLDAKGISAATEVAVASKATNSAGVDYDVAAQTVVLKLAPQYAASAKKAFNGVIDVSLDRQALDAGTGTDTDKANEDILTVKLAHTTVAAGVAGNVVPAKATVVIDGDFSWLIDADTSKDGKVSSAEALTYLNATAAASTGQATFFTTTAGDDTLVSVSVNEDLNKLTALTTVVGGAFNSLDTEYNFALAVKGKGTKSPVLSATEYSATVSVVDAVAAPSTTTMNAGTFAAGAWTLNGSVVTIPYMPFDDNTAVILRHTNTGVQTGDITVRYMLEGVSKDWMNAPITASSTRGVQNIRDLVINAIKDAAGVTSGKVAIEITTNVPEDDVTVYAAYRVKDENDRGFVGTFGKHGSAQ